MSTRFLPLRRSWPRPEPAARKKAAFERNAALVQRRCLILSPPPHPNPLPEEEGAVRSGWGVWSHPDTPHPPSSFPRTREPRVREQARSYEKQKRARSCSGFWTSRETAAHSERPFRRPSETGAQEVMRHGCRESPAGYRDVPSGRASVAGEFVRVARLCRARMSGQAFLVPFVAFDKRDSPEGAKPETSEHSVRRATPSPQVTGFPRSRTAVRHASCY